MSSIKASDFQVIIEPLITEKSSIAGQGNKVVLRVHPKANKIEIRRAVQKLFNVQVVSVRTVNVMGKVKRVRLHSGRQIAWKKAYITLAPGNSISLVEGL